MKLIEKQNGELIYYKHNLTALARKYGTPLKITFLDLVKDRIIELQNAFKEAIADSSYTGHFVYLNANKANYGKEEIETAFIYADGLETSSYYDLLLTHEIYRRYPEFNKKPLVCNGYKLQDYLDEIINVHNEGYDITDIIDSVSEYEYLKSKNVAIKVGLRIHLEAQYNANEEEAKNDRFGLMPNEIEYILSDIKNSKLILTTIHYHQRGFDYVEKKFKLNFEKAFKYYVIAQKQYDTVTNFDIGGGTPLPFEKEFDYASWAKYVISILKELSEKNGVKEPNLISENGKYSQKDATVNIYKVIGVKNTDEYPWYILNGSPMIAMPEKYALDEAITITPINELDGEKLKGRLAGSTCDCDDVLDVSTLPSNTNELYVGLLGTGSYQNSMNGKGGVHHCLLPEEKDVIIYTNNNEEYEIVRHDLQSMEDIYRNLKM